MQGKFSSSHFRGKHKSLAMLDALPHPHPPPPCQFFHFQAIFVENWHKNWLQLAPFLDPPLQISYVKIQYPTQKFCCARVQFVKFAPVRWEGTKIKKYPTRIKSLGIFGLGSSRRVVTIAKNSEMHVLLTDFISSASSKFSTSLRFFFLKKNFFHPNKLLFHLKMFYV